MIYNKALDCVALALAALRKDKPKLAAKLLAKAGSQSDVVAGIKILEASNAAAFEKAQKKVQSKVKANAKSRLQANEEEGEEDPLDEVDADLETLDEPADDAGFDDGSAEAAVEDESCEEPGAAEQMAKVLSSMKKNSKRKAK